MLEHQDARSPTPPVALGPDRRGQREHEERNHDRDAGEFLRRLVRGEPHVQTVVAPTSAPAARAQFLLLPGFEPDRSDGLRVRQRSRDRTRRAVVGRVVVRARDHPEMVTHGDTHGCP